MMEPEWADEVKRFHDGVALHILADAEQARNSWIAVKLSDGSVSSDLYDTRTQAIAHQEKDDEFFYICIPPTGVTYREAEAIIRVNRGLASQGMRMGTEQEFVMPIGEEDVGAPKLTRINFQRMAQLMYVMHNHIQQLPLGPERSWWESEYKRLKGLVHGR